MSDTDICRNPAFRYSLLISSPYTLEGEPRPSGPLMHVASGLFFFSFFKKFVYFWCKRSVARVCLLLSSSLYQMQNLCHTKQRRDRRLHDKKKKKHTLFVLPHHFKKVRITAPHSDKKKKKTSLHESVRYYYYWHDCAWCPDFFADF